MKLRGTQDFYGSKSRLFDRVESVSKRILEDSSFERIRFPLIERADLFKRTISSSDIVNKELYQFTDRGGREIALVPEGTAPVARAVSGASLYPSKHYYISPFFRYDRPQKGRYRQLHQVGAEIVGYKDEFADVESVLILSSIFKKLGIDAKLEVNFLGMEGRERYKKYLSETLSCSDLCDDCKRRVSQNILRVLDCKVCKRNYEDIEKFLDTKERESYEKILSLLQENGIEYEKKNIVRGLDYYTGFVFEFVNELTIAAGGRYDLLYSDISNKDVKAVGFGAGIERMIDLLEDLDKSREEIAVIYVSEDEKREAFRVANLLRSKGISTYSSLDSCKIGKQLSRTRAKYSVILGKEEIENKIFTLKDMDSGGQEKVSLNILLRRYNV